MCFIQLLCSPTRCVLCLIVMFRAAVSTSPCCVGRIVSVCLLPSCLDPCVPLPVLLLAALCLRACSRPLLCCVDALFVRAPFLSCCSRAVFACIVALIALFVHAPFLSCCLHCSRSSPCCHVACSLLFARFSLSRCLLHLQALCCIHLEPSPRFFHALK